MSFPPSYFKRFLDRDLLAITNTPAGQVGGRVLEVDEANCVLRFRAKAASKAGMIPDKTLIIHLPMGDVVEIVEESPIAL